MIRIVRTLARLPITPDRPSRSPDKEIFEYIQAYSSIFEVFFKNIQRIYLIHLVRTGHNGQHRPPAPLLGPPYSLQTPSMTILNMILIPLDHHHTDNLVLLQHGFHTYSQLRTTHMTVHISSQSDSVAIYFLHEDIYFHIAIRQHINLWNLLLKGVDITNITLKHTIKPQVLSSPK
jgi:hypothetical protein